MRRRQRNQLLAAVGTVVAALGLVSFGVYRRSRTEKEPMPPQGRPEISGPEQYRYTVITGRDQVTSDELFDDMKTAARAGKAAAVKAAQRAVAKGDPAVPSPRLAIRENTYATAWICGAEPPASEACAVGIEVTWSPALGYQVFDDTGLL